MKYPSDADIEAAKKIAAMRGTTAELLTYDEPDVNTCVIALAFTAPTWGAYIDAQQRNVSDAKDAAFADHVVWPPSAEADALAERIPALSSLVANDLGELAGNIDAMPKTCPLTAETPASELARAGLTRAKADALIAAASSPLTLARFPTLDITIPGKGFAIVVKVPSRPVYRARLDVYQKAKEAASGTWDSAAQAARDFIVWTSEGDNPDPIFAMYPGVVAGDLISLFVKVGGATAKGERRRL